MSNKPKPTVSMIQMHQTSWLVQSAKGHVLQRDITLSTEHEALEYIKKYISSFNTCWTYEVVPLDKKK
jgi:hypothetical protein